MTVDIDKALGYLGRPGRFHVVVFICLGLNNLVVVLNHLAMVVFAPKTQYHCQIPENLRNTTEDGSSLIADQCAVRENSSFANNWTLVEHPCKDWDYEVPDGEFNLVMKFDLVCDRSYLVHLMTTIYFCGVMIGGIVFGTMSDLFGRKPFLLLAQYMQIGIGIWTAFANNLILFIFLRFIQGFLMQGLQTASLVLIMEMFPRRYSSIVGSVFEVFWGVGVMWLAFLAYFFQNWRYIQLAATVPSIITVVYIWLVPESIRWLISQNKYSKAEKVLKRAAKFNKVTLPSDPLQLKNDPSEKNNFTSDKGLSKQKTAKYSLIDMFRTSELRKRSFLQFYIWFVVTANYYGISLRLSSFAGNKYLNFFFGGLCELPVYCAAWFIISKLGRRLPLIVYLIFGGITGIGAGVTSMLFRGDPDLSHFAWVTTTLAVLSRMNMAGCFSILWLYTSELYPTVIRNVSVGACVFWMRVGALVAPQILHLGDLTYPFIPIIILGTLCFIGGLVTLLLPETKDTKLPESLSDVTKMKSDKQAYGVYQACQEQEAGVEMNNVESKIKPSDSEELPKSSQHVDSQAKLLAEDNTEVPI